MGVQGRSGRLMAAVKLLPLICVVFSISLSSQQSAVVDSFVLRNGGQVDFIDNRNDDEEDEEDGFNDHLSPFDIKRMADDDDDEVYSFPERYENVNQPDDQTRNGFTIYSDEDIMNAFDNSDVDDDSPKLEQQWPDDSKTALDKAELRDIFDIGKANADEYEIATDEMLREGSDDEDSTESVDKKTELSKNEVEHLFNQASRAELVENEQSEFISQPPIVTVTASNFSSAHDGVIKLSATPPTIRVTTVKELESDGGTNGFGEKKVTLDVKEENLNPDNDDEKTTEEWMVELTQPEGEEWKAIMNGGGRKGKKFKRSPKLPYDEDEYQSTSEISKYNVAKTRAVDLLSTYIQLQRDENRHLTEALDLATRGQTEVSGDYIGPEVEHLRQAINDEREMEKIRDSIKESTISERKLSFVDEDELPEGLEEMNNEIFNDADTDKLQETPTLVTRRNQLVDAVEEDEDSDEGVEELPMMTFNDANEDDDDDDNYNELNYEDDEDSERENDGENDNDEIMRARLFQAEDEQNRINRLRQAAALDKINRLMVMEEDLPLTKPYRATFRGQFRFNPFSRDLKEVQQKQDFRRLNKRLSALPEETAPLYYETPAVGDVEQEPDVSELFNIIQQTDDDNEWIQQQRSDETVMCPSVRELTDNCLVARERGLVLDDEALELCNRHQLCYSCGLEHGLTPEICDRGYLSESDLLCTESVSIGRLVNGHTSKSRCKADAASLYAIMLDGHRYHDITSGFSMPPSCQHRCTYNFIVGTSGGSRGGF